MKYIPKKTLQKLENPPPPGQRHQWMITVGIPLIGNGWEPDEVFKIFRSKFPENGLEAVSDEEINSILEGIVAYEPEPSVRQKGNVPPSAKPFTPLPAPKAAPSNQVSPIAAITSFLNGFQISEEEVLKLSPEQANHPVEQMGLFIQGLFKRGEFINIVTDYWEVRGKGIPKGQGETKLYSNWCFELAQTKEVPASEAGAWIRINPTDGTYIKNKNITHFRYFLLEMDNTPLDLQLAFFCKLELPVVALVKSGASSIHCWVKLDAKDYQDYRSQVGECYEILREFGIDQANKNPSRLARLPGAKRVIGASADGVQRLLYLNPNPSELGILAGPPSGAAPTEEVVCP